jgi:putative hemolysin
LSNYKKLFGLKSLPGEAEGVYQTLGGFVITHLARIPIVSDSFEWHGLRIEVVDMDRRRVDKVLVEVVGSQAAE